MMRRSNAVSDPAAFSAATRPSWTALCASIGCPTTSPTAKMWGTFVRCRTATDRHQDLVEDVGARRRRSVERDDETIGPRVDAGHLGPQEDVLVPLLDPFRERRDEVRISAGNELVQHLDHSDPAPELVVHGGHLQPDDPAADDQ